ncbi:MAG: rRNA pseudouridine synthase, partial [Lachnospiraceae bacterium]|nr:rRNA pseudouridine synthase [Lachnospiraceae bacterium]
MRLDKFLCEMNIGTRSQVKDYIRRGEVTLNSREVKSPDMKIDENNDKICFRGIEIVFEKYVYYMLNKPAGVVSATKDNTADTVLSLIEGASKKGLFPMGRLDKDTEGILIITNDGELAHRLLSPKNHVDKTYLVQTALPVSSEAAAWLESGVDIGDDRLTAPAKVKILSDSHILLTIHEGRFHQVKRMLKAVDNGAVGLKRISFGNLELDKKLKPGESRRLTDREVELLN